MAVSKPRFQPKSVAVTFRYAQGYRFLDVCGETLIELENALGTGWIVAKALPTGGEIKNDATFAAITFNSSNFGFQQSHKLELRPVLHECLTAFDIVRRRLKVSTAISPAIQITFQRGYERHELERAEQDFMKFDVFAVDEALVNRMGGKKTTLDFTVVTMAEGVKNYGSEVTQRRRVAARIVQQEQIQPYDERLLVRPRQLPAKQNEALKSLQKIRQEMPDLKPVAIQLDCETAAEGEFPIIDFEFESFFRESWTWAESMPVLFVTK